MSNIHYLDISFSKALNSHKITNELIEILYDLLPTRFAFWALKLAQSRYNERQASGETTWLDKMQVYVGLPDWVVSEEQMISENVHHLKCPFGLLQDISNVTHDSVFCAVPYLKTDSISKKRYSVFLHDKSLTIEYNAHLLDSDILSQKADFEDVDDQYERLIQNELAHVCEKKEYLVKRILRERYNEENIHVLRNAISTCLQMARGEKEVIEAFIGVSNISDEDVEEARAIYSKLDIEEFFEWASHHFAIDDFYEDEEDLIDHIKFIISNDNMHLSNDKKYKFITEIIGRSAPSFKYFA